MSFVNCDYMNHLKNIAAGWTRDKLLKDFAHFRNFLE